ncbi:hypothetical protein Hypma_014505 [Hypsizygus marmoreus]|uniref:Uncharacterized protein n=1 Tax=Hypsizygus marmoreus TaxID=39966 RepID=A0A369JE18_HYPMA|nr:hypothetical protein Hypma_014505 [Hypsizygus marmoreus]
MASPGQQDNPISSRWAGRRGSRSGCARQLRATACLECTRRLLTGTSTRKIGTGAQQRTVGGGKRAPWISGRKRSYASECARCSTIHWH